MMRAVLVTSVLISSAVLSSGCCYDVDCGACPPPISLDINVDDPGTVFEDLVVIGSGGEDLATEDNCNVREGFIDCMMFDSSDPGTYTYEVSAPGYVTQTVSVEVTESEGRGCCTCPSNSIEFEVFMEAES